MGSKFALVNKKEVIGTEPINKSAADAYISRYQISTQNAIDNILNMGEAVYEIYMKCKSGEMEKEELDYFCKCVGLDSKGAMFRKYKAIGINAPKFRLCMNKLPPTLTTLYEMATLDFDDFERYVVRSSFSSNITHEQFMKMIDKKSVLTKNRFMNPPQIGITRLGLAKVLKKINDFSIHIVRDLPESDFRKITSVLADFRNKGWINFNDPEITGHIDDEIVIENQIDDDKYFITLADQDVRELRM